MVGQGDGVKIISSSDLEAKSYVWKNVIDELNYTVLGRKNKISNLKEISCLSSVVVESLEKQKQQVPGYS